MPLVRAARAESAAQADVEVKNPFELKSAAAFAAAFALVILASRFLRDRFGDVALYLAAVVAGLTDVDAITFSTARRWPGKGWAFQPPWCQFDHTARHHPHIPWGDGAWMGIGPVRSVRAKSRG